MDLQNFMIFDKYKLQITKSSKWDGVNFINFLLILVRQRAIQSWVLSLHYFLCITAVLRTLYSYFFTLKNVLLLVLIIPILQQTKIFLVFAVR